MYNNNYQTQQEQSFTSSLLSKYANPLNPIGTSMNITATGTVLQAYRYKTWANLGAGKGLNWGGVWGARSIMSGQAGGTSFMKFNPLRRITQSAVGGFSSEATAAANVSKFKAGGFLGKGGLFGKFTEGTYESKGIGGKIAKIAAGLFGGNVNLFSYGDMVDKSTADAFSKYSPTIRSKYAKSNMAAYDRIKTAFFTEYKGADSFKKTTLDIINDIKDQGYKGNAGKLRKILLSKDNNKFIKGVRFASTVGKTFSVVAGAKLMFDIASAGTQGVINLGGSLVEKAEAKMEMFGNRGLEMGGQVGPGFMTSGAATERMRALQAIGNTGRQSRGMMGNEAGLQHVASTW